MKGWNLFMEKRRSRLWRLVEGKTFGLSRSVFQVSGVSSLRTSGREDLSSCHRKGNYFILITEKSSGGLGQIQSIVSKIERTSILLGCGWTFSVNPRNLGPRTFVTTKSSPENRMGKALYDSFKEIRNSGNFSGLDAVEEIGRGLRSMGWFETRTGNCGYDELLRRGTTTDALTFALNGVEQRSRLIGLEIPIRTLPTWKVPNRAKEESPLFSKGNTDPNRNPLNCIRPFSTTKGMLTVVVYLIVRINSPTWKTYLKPLTPVALWSWGRSGFQWLGEEARRILSEEGQVNIGNDCEDL